MNVLTVPISGFATGSRPVAKFGRGTIVNVLKLEENNDLTGNMARVTFYRWFRDIGYIYEVTAMDDLNEKVVVTVPEYGLDLVRLKQSGS